MNYLFYGINNYEIKNEISNILKGKSSFNVSKYDLLEDDIKDVINDAITMSLFEDEKIIICENALCFSGSEKTDEALEKYLENPNPSAIIIFVLNKEKIDERKKITKLIKANGTIKSFVNTSSESLIKNLLKDYKISSKAINLLIERAGQNQDILINEINKIIIYKDDNIVTEEDIINLTHKEVDTDIFSLIDFIVTKNTKKALEIYCELIYRGEEPLKIIIMLANQFRLLYQCKCLRNKGYSEKDIASILAVHPYRVKLALQKASQYSSKGLLKYLSMLSDIDIKIKSGEINKETALEFFILEI